MKVHYWIWILLLGIACSDKQITQPEEGQLQLQLAASGAGRFEDYVHSLGIYAFRRIPGEQFVYAGTLAELNEQEIAALEDAAGGGNAKYFTAELKMGTYELYVAANAAGRIRSDWAEGRTTPGEVILEGAAEGQDSVYFLGNVRVELAGQHTPPVRIQLNRVVSKLVVVLYGLPVEIHRVGLVLDHIVTGVRLNGEALTDTRTYRREMTVSGQTGYARDTLVSENVLLPSAAGGSGLQLSFYAVNGQEKVKEMPRQTLLPDQYIRISGRINEQPGGLLDFNIRMNILLLDYWLDRPLPDFSLTPQNS